MRDHPTWQTEDVKQTYRPRFAPMDMRTFISLEEIADHMDRVTWHGRYFAAKCVYHDDREPSMLVFEDGAYCLGCQRRVSLEILWNKVRGKYKLAPDPVIVSAWTNMGDDLSQVVYEAHNVLLQYPAQATYLKVRGVSERIEPNTLGWYMGWYTFPVFDRGFELRGLVLRSSPELEKSSGTRYLCPPNQSPQIYCPDWHKVDSLRYLYVVYGIIDALALACLGFPVVTCTKGQNFHADLLKEFRTKIIIVPDRGEEKSARILASNLGWRGSVLYLDYPDKCKDPANFMATRKLQDNLLRQLSR